MEHLPRNTASVPLLQGGGLWQRIRRWLSAIAGQPHGEGSGKVSNGNGNQAVQSPNAEAVGLEQQSDTDALLDRKLIDRWNATENEAGRPEGRVVPALVLGEQRYPDPSVWGPETERPLMQDPDYQAALSFLSSLDKTRERD